MNSSLQRMADRDWGPAPARHLLWRAGLGGGPDDVADLARRGLDEAVDRLVNYEAIDAGGLAEPEVDPDVIHPPSAEQRRAARIARREEDTEFRDLMRQKRRERRKQDRAMMRGLRTWWLDRMIRTPRPLEESLTLCWHGHFATRYRKVRDAYLMYQQNALLRRQAAGNFASLARSIVRDPAMLKFLNNDRNVARRPNENLARELMELFTLGEGHYRERDIKEGARALSGYHVNDNDFRFRPRAHDSAPKTILGRTGEFDGDDLVDILLAQRQCASFVAYKLYRHFVADVDGSDVPAGRRQVIERLADLLRQHRFDLRPVLHVLLRSQHFYDASVVGQKIKSPVQLLVGTVRAMQTPVRDHGVVHQALRMMGQTLFDPPSVAGWDGGRAWINTSTLFVRQNVCTYLLTGKSPTRGRWSREQLAYDPMVLLAGVDQKPKAVVNHLVDALLGPHVSAGRRQPLLDFMRRRDRGVTADSVLGLLLLICAMPEYQLC